MYVSAVISRMTKPTKTMPKRLYICGWIEDAEGERRYPRAVYDLGDRPDAKRKPLETLAEKRRRWNRYRQARATMNSVFNLGLTRRQFEAIRRGKIGKHGKDQQQGQGCGG